MTMTEILKDESRWSRQFTASSASGAPVFPTSGLAVKWCPWGAALKLNNDRKYKNRRVSAILYRILKRQYKYDSVVDFNTNPKTTFKDVQRVCKLVDKELGLA